MRRRGTIWWLAVPLTVLAGPGCAPLVPFRNQPVGIMTGTPHGLYAATLHLPFSGSVTTRLAAEPTRNGFRANSRPGTLGELQGGASGAWVNLVGVADCPGGVLLHWTSSAPTDTEPARGVLHCPMLAPLATTLRTVDQPVELRTPDNGRLVGLLTLEPGAVDTGPLRDYAALADEAAAVLAEQLFDPQLVTAADTRAFLADVHRIARLAQDDAEFLAGWFVAARRLAFSHCYLSRALDPEAGAQLARAQQGAEEPGPEAPLAFAVADQIATLRIRKFDEGLEPQIDGAFAELDRLGAAALILDLRGNPGGTFSAARVAAHLIDAPLDGGIFFTRRARQRVLAGQTDSFPRVSALASVTEFYARLDESGALVWRVEPVAPHFAGPVVILIDRAVASAAEPLVAGLHEAGRTILIGEHTAGVMLSMQPFPLSGGWILSVPTADYLTARGIRIEGRGVRPDIETPSAAAPSAARAYLAKRI